jgi:hypothetical protein
MATIITPLVLCCKNNIEQGTSPLHPINRPPAGQPGPFSRALVCYAVVQSFNFKKVTLTMLNMGDYLFLAILTLGFLS